MSICDATEQKDEVESINKFASHFRRSKLGGNAKQKKTKKFRKTLRPLDSRGGKKRSAKKRTAKKRSK
jgi:hypothetical protein